MATIRKRRRKDGALTYHVQVRLKGSPPQTATFHRLTDARKWVQNTESAIREGRYFKTTEAKRHIVAELIDRYIREYLPQKKDRRNQLRQLEDWKSRIGEMLLADVTPALLSEQREILASEMTVRGSPRSPATVNRRLAVLSHAFTIAVREWGWIESNPLRKVKKKKEPRGRDRYLTEIEKNQLLEACLNSDSRLLYPVVLFAIQTGARKGEILGLKWGDVDLRRSMAIFRDTKNMDRRSVPLSAHLVNILSDLKKVRRIDTDLVFPRPDGLQPVELRTHWRKALTKAGIVDFRFHDLRHTAASYLVMSGASLPEIAEILGHKQFEMVKRYAHLSQDHKAEVLANMHKTYFP